MSKSNADDLQKEEGTCEAFAANEASPVDDKSGNIFNSKNEVRKSDGASFEALPDAQHLLEAQQEQLGENVVVVPTQENMTDIEQREFAVNTVTFSGSQDDEEPLVTEPKSKKSFIEVEVTANGVTRTEVFEAEELAYLYMQQQVALRHVSGEFNFLYVPDWVRLHPLLGSYLAEIVGTFTCVLTLSLVSVRNQSIFSKGIDTSITCLPIGFMFLCMVFTFGYISGGHFNPAVTFAVFLVRKLSFANAISYLICQTAASLGAGLVAMAIQGSTDIFVPHISNEYISSGIFAELIFTFAIAIVVLNVAYSRQSGNFFYGFAIGMTIVGGTAAVGSISGGAFNPAAATGLQVALCISGNCAPLAYFWVYWMAPLLGSLLAAILYSQLAQPEDTYALTDTAVVHGDGTAINET